MSVPSDRKYLATHEWHKTEGDVVLIGITQIAADELTDITFVDLPKVGTRVVAGKPFGVIESVKATSDLYCGISGEIVAINDALKNDPGLVNRDPYQGAWMIKVKPANAGELDKLLSGDDYLKQTGH